MTDLFYFLNEDKRDARNKQVLYPSNYNTVNVNLNLPIGFWVLGVLLIVLMFVIAFGVIGYMNPIEHVNQII